MTVTITLPCGCELTASSVVAMCLRHVYELRALEAKADEDYKNVLDRFRTAISDALRR